MGLSFIIIENTELDYVVAGKQIARTVRDANVKTFPSADEALIEIAAGGVQGPVVILLDLMMPKINGFQFIESFESLSHEIQENYFIVVLTSVLNQTELDRIRGRKSVKMVLNKPITIEKVESIVEKLRVAIDEK
jgi:DNA-binding response OmpR family regulator